MRHLPTLPELTGLHESGGSLMGTTTRGPLALYRYVPLQGAVLTGQVIPFAARWPEHLKLLIYRYSPVPPLPRGILPPHLLERLGVRPRDLDGLRPWDQLTYQGWPVYVCLLDRPGARPAGIIESQFEQLRLDVQPLGLPGSAGQGP
ncbi:hypothetical protein E7T09_00465 [Deinococcus sp. KSM4-11]|uniref:hypothetical protein n=1 Tax=Deinococcus sp. KSM4-11 TaxID=2568654 RepID=UPI0010A3B494|nr:hypothetical protein [Deinococcus sp. KSM4-11]THF87753.1 hypothetical protein E7T09_00465 [Deinococcus sp. KSM4-11]